MTTEMRRASRPRPQTVIISCTRLFFDALILHLSENNGAIARRLAIGRRGGIDQMATLDEIGQEKQRISERLARIDAERTKLADQLSELEITERVLTRFGGSADTAARRRRGRPARTAPAAAPQRRARGGQQAAASVSLADATLPAGSKTAISAGTSRHRRSVSNQTTPRRPADPRAPRFQSEAAIAGPIWKRVRPPDDWAR